MNMPIPRWKILRRIQREYDMIVNDPEDNISVGITDNDFFTWKVVMTGFENTSYEGGVFELKVTIPDDYPFIGPKVQFLTKIYHPNVTEQGGLIITSPELFVGWAPNNRIMDVLKYVYQLLDGSMENIHHAESGSIMKNKYIRDLMTLYLEDRVEFDVKAMEYTEIYAS